MIDSFELRVSCVISSGISIVDYDILWGVTNWLYVNECVRDDIEESRINGVEISQIFEPECFTKTEYENLFPK